MIEGLPSLPKYCIFKRGNQPQIKGRGTQFHFCKNIITPELFKVYKQYIFKNVNEKFPLKTFYFIQHIYTQYLLIFSTFVKSPLQTVHIRIKQVIKYQVVMTWWKLSNKGRVHGKFHTRGVGGRSARVIFHIQFFKENFPLQMV